MFLLLLINDLFKLLGILCHSVQLTVLHQFGLVCRLLSGDVRVFLLLLINDVSKLLGIRCHTVQLTCLLQFGFLCRLLSRDREEVHVGTR